MANPVLWGLLGTIVALAFSLWIALLSVWHFTGLPDAAADPNRAWQWAIHESQVMRHMSTFQDLGARLNHLNLSPSDPQFDLLFLTADLLLVGYAFMRIVTPTPTLAYRLALGTFISLVTSTFTLIPIPAHAIGFPLLAYTRLGLWLDPLCVGRTIVGIDGWRHGGPGFRWVALALVPMMAIATAAIGSAMGGSAVGGVCVGVLCSFCLRNTEKRYYFSDAPATFPDPPAESVPMEPRSTRAPSPSPSSQSGLP